MIVLHLLWLAAIVVIAAVLEDYRTKRMAEKEMEKRMTQFSGEDE